MENEYSEFFTGQSQLPHQVPTQQNVYLPQQHFERFTDQNPQQYILTDPLRGELESMQEEQERDDSFMQHPSSSNSGAQWQNQLPPQLQQVPLQQLAQDLGPHPPAYRPKNPVPVLLQPQPCQASGINMTPNCQQPQHQASHSPEGKSIIILLFPKVTPSYCEISILSTLQQQ